MASSTAVLPPPVGPVRANRSTPSKSIRPVVAEGREPLQLEAHAASRRRPPRAARRRARRSRGSSTPALGRGRRRTARPGCRPSSRVSCAVRRGARSAVRRRLDDHVDGTGEQGPDLVGQPDPELLAHPHLEERTGRRGRRRRSPRARPACRPARPAAPARTARGTTSVVAGAAGRRFDHHGGLGLAGLAEVELEGRTGVADGARAGDGLGAVEVAEGDVVARGREGGGADAVGLGEVGGALAAARRRCPSRRCGRPRR